MKAKVKIFCILIGLLFSTNIFCQVDAFTIIDKWENGSTKTAYKIVGRDSISHEYFSNGKMRACGKNIRGTASSSGTFSLYYDNGQLYYQMFHKNHDIARSEI